MMGRTSRASSPALPSGPAADGAERKPGLVAPCPWVWRACDASPWMLVASDHVTPLDGPKVPTIPDRGGGVSGERRLRNR